MNKRQLKIFAKVYELKSMTLAAESLFISQPSVSQVIREIEEHYNKKFFERYPKQLYPTPEGDILYSYIKQIFNLLEQAEEAFDDISRKRTITVGVNISIGTALMIGFVKTMNAEHPEVRVKVIVGGSALLKEKIYKNEIDFALTEDISEDPILIQEPFYSDRIVVICDPKNPLAKKKKVELSDLGSCEFLLRNKGVGVRDKFDYLMNFYGIQVDPLWESTDTRAIINAAKNGIGIAFLPYLLVKSALERGELSIVKVDDKLLSRNLNIVYHKNKLLNESQKAFLEIVHRGVKEEDIL